MFEAVGEFFRTDQSPVNTLYKAITKILVKRLQRVLPLMIDHSQNAFVPGRSISDNILLAQELLAGYNQARLPARCMLKVDIQKAYDSVEWDFLLETLRLFNFPQQFIILIKQCVSTASFSISLNGSIYGFFKSSRGLRQGDPISPYLFVLVMEVWSTLIRHRVQQATQFQYHWKCKELGLINLCFADDVLLFCKAHIPSIKVLTDTLSEFASLSGLKVNPVKSQIIISRAVQQERQHILEYVGFQEGSLPVKYLGIPLTSSRLTFVDCRPLIDKVDARLAGAGNAKVAWDQLCKPKAEGGLGVRRLVTANQALILKQLWRILQNDGTSIWVDWIHQNRLRHTTIWTFNRDTGSWSWKKMLKLRPLLQRGVVYKVGDGSSFNLWQDIWHDRGPLCLNYPRGPAITGLPLSSTLSSVLQQNSWNWPATTDADIAEIISQLPPTYPAAPDTICWRNFWIARHGFILWLAMLEKLSTMDKPWIQGDTNGCVLCGGQFIESHNHLFFNCWYSKRCLAILKNEIKFQWPYEEWQRGITWASKRWRGNHLVNAALRATLAALVYRLWAERNNRIFAATSSPAEITSKNVLEDVRMRIMVADISLSLQARNLYRIWKLAWPLEQ
ncbi:UNVERIFIED_CONTAM: putative mitochondrial protein [Sesamum calycinum]|uniref:Mitochondrial protein n=1 Tax=Sesamum calycinum TaxID=2727403 RepID=A0AAW2KFG6_9LAMI